jgi:hypothetical protein
MARASRWRGRPGGQHLAHHVVRAGAGAVRRRRAAGWRPASLPPAALFLLAWLVAPALADWISRPIARKHAQLSPSSSFLHTLARRTWAYFERFVGPDDNWLPPDNMQEHPVQVVAHRTSPTNIGMALLANLTACDFGYITVAS